MHEKADIEVGADRWDEEQEFLREFQAFEARERAELDGPIAGSDEAFEPGEIVMFAGEPYEVVENFGDSGTVKALSDGGTLVTGFRWVFEGERCRRADSCDALMIMDGAGKR